MTNKTGNVWHVFVKGDFEDTLYGYKFDGKFSPEEGHYYDASKIVLDPYAKVIDLNHMPHMRFINSFLVLMFEDSSFVLLF